MSELRSTNKVAPRRALFISVSFPPLAESQTIRNVYLVRGLLKAGWEVDVVTPSFEEGDRAVMDFIGGKVTIYRTRLPVFDWMMAKLSTRKKIPLLRYMRSAFAVAWGKLAVPDIRSDWARPATRMVARLCQEQSYSLLISSAGSNTAHRAAAVAAARFDIPWLAEYGDPWALNPLPPASLPRIRAKNMRMEKEALRRCGGMTVTTEQTKVLYQDWLKTDCPRIEVVPCGFDVDLIANQVGGDASERKLTLTVAYIGSASRGNRDLRKIMVVMDEVAREMAAIKIELRVVGAFSPFFSHLSDELKRLKVTYSGWVSYPASIREIGNADVLLLYGNRSAVQIPGKVFPYLASGRPILYVAQMDLELDPTWRLIRDFGGIVALRKGDSAWQRTIGDWIGRFPEWERAAAERIADHRLSEFEWHAVGFRFAAFAGNVAAGTPSHGPRS